MKTRGTSFLMGWAMLWAVFATVPCSAYPERGLGPEPPAPDRATLLPTLQKAVGNDWSVTAIAGGYDVTSVKSFSLLPDVSPGTKMNFGQRMASTRPRRISIHVLFSPPDAKWSPFVRVAGGLAEAQRADDYFPCCTWSWEENPYFVCSRRGVPKYAVSIFSNVSPDESIHPKGPSDEYDAVVDHLSRVFFNPLMEIED